MKEKVVGVGLWAVVVVSGGVVGVFGVYQVAKKRRLLGKSRRFG